MRMSTLASFNGHEIYRDMSGSIFLDGVQYDSAMDAAYHAPDDIRREMIKQVYDTQLNYIDGPAAYDDWKKKTEGFKESTDPSVTVEGTNEVQ